MRIRRDLGMYVLGRVPSGAEDVPSALPALAGCGEHACHALSQHHLPRMYVCTSTDFQRPKPQMASSKQNNYILTYLRGRSQSNPSGPDQNLEPRTMNHSGPIISNFDQNSGECQTMIRKTLLKERKKIWEAGGERARVPSNVSKGKGNFRQPCLSHFGSHC